MSSDGVFSATMSFHNMLKRAQALSPVLTYVLCKLLMESETESGHTRGIKAICESPRVCIGDSTASSSSYYFLADNQMETFIADIFQNITVSISEPGQQCSEERRHVNLIAHRQFVLWLKELDLTFDDEKGLVSIPA